MGSEFRSRPRDTQYLAPYDALGSSLNQSLKQVAQDVVAANCDRVGLHLEFDAPEYLIWVFLKQRGFAGRLDHFGVTNETRELLARTSLPQAVIALNHQSLPVDMTNSFPYRTERGRVKVYWSAASPSSPPNRSPFSFSRRPVKKPFLSNWPMRMAFGHGSFP